MTEKKNNPFASILAIIALAAGITAVAVGGIHGRRAGYEMMMMYTSPAVLAGLLSVAIQRRGLTYAGLLGAVLGIVGFVLGR
ncbi:MAG: hypothetical protein ACRBN8_40300 [Nannocystales bacterium]